EVACAGQRSQACVLPRHSAEADRPRAPRHEQAAADVFPAGAAVRLAARRTVIVLNLRVVMPGLVPGIHVFKAIRQAQTWLSGTSPAMTNKACSFGSYSSNMSSCRRGTNPQGQAALIR